MLKRNTKLRGVDEEWKYFKESFSQPVGEMYVEYDVLGKDKGRGSEPWNEEIWTDPIKREPFGRFPTERWRVLRREPIMM